jgi:hypothetical protein
MGYFTAYQEVLTTTFAHDRVVYTFIADAWLRIRQSC